MRCLITLQFEECIFCIPPALDVSFIVSNVFYAGKLLRSAERVVIETDSLRHCNLARSQEYGLIVLLIKKVTS